MYERRKVRAKIGGSVAEVWEGDGREGEVWEERRKQRVEGKVEVWEQVEMEEVYIEITLICECGLP